MTTVREPTPELDAVSGVRPRLLLLDGHSLAYRAFFALPVENFSTTTGQPTNAVYGFTSMLINLLRDEEPTHVAVAFDVSRQTFRSEAYAQYKAGRSETPADFRGQVSLIREVLGALRIPTVSIEHYEADDVIATITTRAVAAGADVLICTGDRDALQLVSANVTVLYPRKGVSDMWRFTPDSVQEKYGLTPAQYPDFAALRGDPSDNLPGIPGVGEKTASKWVRDFGTLDQLVAQVDTVKGKVGDALREHLGSVLRNRQLTELVRAALRHADRGPARGRGGLRRRRRPAGPRRGHRLARRTRRRPGPGRVDLPRLLGPRYRSPPRGRRRRRRRPQRVHGPGGPGPRG